MLSDGPVLHMETNLTRIAERLIILAHQRDAQIDSYIPKSRSIDRLCLNLSSGCGHVATVEPGVQRGTRPARKIRGKFGNAGAVDGAGLGNSTDSSPIITGFHVTFIDGNEYFLLERS